MLPTSTPDLPETFRRKSNGLSHFFDTFPDRPNLEVLDLGGLTQSNVNFLSEHGCKIHALDLLADFDYCKEHLPDRQFDSQTAQQFIDEYLSYKVDQFDAILGWDTLEHLDADLLSLAVPWLGEILCPNGGLLTFFHTQSRGEMVRVYRYQIEDSQVLALQVRQQRTLPQTFNNRSLERLFGSFRSVKFFLTRDSLREVIAVR